MCVPLAAPISIQVAYIQCVRPANVCRDGYLPCSAVSHVLVKNCHIRVSSSLNVCARVVCVFVSLCMHACARFVVPSRRHELALRILTLLQDSLQALQTSFVINDHFFSFSLRYPKAREQFRECTCECVPGHRGARET